MLEKGDIRTFDARKNFTYIKRLGGGGTGDTHLFKDETTNMMFAIKKYIPKDEKYIDDYYKRFVDEIIILFNISHPNIVRIYNYYLYPTKKTGYLQMEYIEGDDIDKFEPDFLDDKDWNDIFYEVISAFEYLEQNHILHRDVRPANIMIDKDCNVKIIDFGFGKQLDGTKNEKNSILLNWPVTEMPNEIQNNDEYDTRTEIYFVGALFKNLLKDYSDYFNYNHILEKMTKTNPIQRYDSFTDVLSDISAGVMREIDFTDREKEIYQDFADELTNHISTYIDRYMPVNDILLTITGLEELIRNSALEKYIQNNNELINCFIKGGFTYIPSKNIEVEVVKDFYEFIKNLTSHKQKVVADNINSRLSTIKIKIEEDDLPF